MILKNIIRNKNKKDKSINEEKGLKVKHTICLLKRLLSLH